MKMKCNFYADKYYWYDYWIWNLMHTITIIISVIKKGGKELNCCFPNESQPSLLWLLKKTKTIQIKKHHSWFFLVTFFPLWTSQSFTADAGEPRMITECVFSYCHCCFVSGPELELERVTATRDGAPLLLPELLQAGPGFWLFFLTHSCCLNEKWRETRRPAPSEGPPNPHHHLPEELWTKEKKQQGN